MTKPEFQKELIEKIKPGVKPSKLKKSKSADDIITPVSNIPLKKSHSQLEIPVIQQPSPQEQIIKLKNSVKFHAQTATNYLSSLQTSQAKVSELEKRLKTYPPNPLLQDQLKTKQQEIENLREKLDDSNQKLADATTELDNSLLARHKSLKDWWQQYSKSKALDQELVDNVNEASDELLNQDDIISQLRIENNQLKKANNSLQKDLKLSQRLAEMRKVPLPNNENNWGEYLKFTFYSFCAVAFTLWITNNWKTNKNHGNSKP